MGGKWEIEGVTDPAGWPQLTQGLSGPVGAFLIYLSHVGLVGPEHVRAQSLTFRASLAAWGGPEPLGHGGCPDQHRGVSCGTLCTLCFKAQ